MNLNLEHIYQTLQTQFGSRVRCHESLATHCAFAVGGLADIWVSLETSQEVGKLVNLCAEQRCPLLLVGGGRNMLFADEGVRGVVAQMNTHRYVLEDQGDHTALLTADAGVHWSTLLEDLLTRGWGGLEFGAGIPGTLGGGIVSNVRAYQYSLSQLVESIDVLDARGSNHADEGDFAPAVMRHYLQNELDFGYRHSRFRTERSIRMNDLGEFIFPLRGLIEPGEIILQVVLRLHQQSPQQLKNQYAHYLQTRHGVNPDFPRTGPVFKDSSEYRPGDLIKRAGLAGRRVGNAQIMEQNANYIANLGEATTKDIGTLIIEAYRSVFRQFGISLGLNIDLQGEWQ
ncbi:MAG TPA: FAD-binding protein [Ktedonobacteraceae bacterium]|nr:FAD-binding protein [Ktedonobacteraceae bacterium]